MNTATWPYMADKEHEFYVLGVKKDGIVEPYVASPTEAQQESYCEEKYQEESLMIIFTERAGTEAHAKYLANEAKSDTSKMALIVGNINTMFNLFKTVNERSIDIYGRSLRVEVYHFEGGECVDFEIIFSHWITKH